MGGLPKKHQARVAHRSAGCGQPSPRSGGSHREPPGVVSRSLGTVTRFSTCAPNASATVHEERGTTGEGDAHQRLAVVVNPYLEGLSALRTSLGKGTPWRLSTPEMAETLRSDHLRVEGTSIWHRFNHLLRITRTTATTRADDRLDDARPDFGPTTHSICDFRDHSWPTNQQRAAVAHDTVARVSPRR
jgi:hypothetical protein